MSIRPGTQIYNTNVYDDQIAGIGVQATYEPAVSASDGEFDLNTMRTVLNLIVSNQGGNWYDDLAGRDLNLTSADLLSLEVRPVTCNASILTQFAVPNGQNWIILSVAGSEAPSLGGSQSDAVEGAIVATSSLSGGAFDVFELTERTSVGDGAALSPLNLERVVGTDGKPIQSASGEDVLSLMTVEQTFTPDGGAFNDVSGENRVKLSFVIPNAGRTDLIACPVADIENVTIAYNYLFNQLLENLDPSCFTGSRGFVDSGPDVALTLNNAIAGQGSGAFIAANSINLGLTDGEFWDFEDSAGATLLRTISNVATSQSMVVVGPDTDVFDNNAVVNDFVAGATMGSGLASSINVAVASGLIVATGVLTLESNSADITVMSSGGGAVRLDSAVNVVVDADTTIALNTADDTDASLKSIDITAASSTAGNAIGAPVNVNTGDGFGTAMGGLFGVNLGLGGASGDAGYMDVTHGGTDEMRVAQFSVAGVGAGLFGLFSGSSSPDGRVDADGDIGSLFVDSTAGVMYISTDGVQAWTAFAVGGAENLAATLAVGDFTGGNDIVVTNLDVIHGEDAAAPGALILDGGDATIAATDGAGVAATGGSGNTSGGGGPVSATGGTPGVTGDGGDFSGVGGPGGATTGNAGDANLSGGIPSEGNGGSVTLTGEAGVGTDRSGGGVGIFAGNGTGTIDGALITMTPGSVTGSGSRGYVTIDAANDDDEHIFQLDTGGTNGSVTQMLVGDRDPNAAVIFARPSALYFRNQLAAGAPSIWLNTSVTAGEGSSWEEIVSGVVTADTWAAVLATGDFSGGTSPVMTSGDDIIGEDSAVATATGYTLRGGDHNGAAVGPFSGGPMVAKGGDSDASANGSSGGLLSLEGGEYTGTGGGLSAGGGVAIAGGRATVGGGLADGGFVTIEGGEGFEIGGPVTITAGRGQTAGGADASLIGGRGATDAGNVFVTGGLTDGGNAADDGGTVNISSGGGTVAPYNTGSINILVPQVGPANNIAGGSVTIEAGNTGTRNVPGGDVHTSAGDNAGGGANRAGEITWRTGTQTGGAGGPGGDATLTLGGSTNSTPGVFVVTGPQDEDEELMTLTTTGSGGESMSVFVGQLVPSAGAGVSADEGSIYHRDDGAGLGEMYIKIGAGNTDWALVQTGSGDTTLSEAIALETAANFIAANGTSWGNADNASFALTGPGGGGDEIFQVNALAAGNTVVVDGDTTINGNDANGGNSIQLLAGAGVAATNGGTGVRLVGGQGNTTGPGGTLSGAAGGGGANGDGGPLLWDSGDGGGTTGNSGDVEISTGTVTDGDTGDITLNVENAVGVGTAGGSIFLDPGDSPDSIDGGNTVIRTGSSGSADAGFVHFDTPNDADEHWGQITTGGVDGTVVQLLAGVNDPNTDSIAAFGGSIYQQRVVAAAGSSIWVNENETAGEAVLWGQVLTDNSRSIGQGIASGTIAANTDISDQAAASNVTMDFGTFPTIPSTQAEMDVRTAVFVNGVRQRSGVTVVRTGTQATAIQLTFGLVLGDVVTVEQWTV